MFYYNYILQWAGHMIPQPKIRLQVHGTYQCAKVRGVGKRRGRRKRSKNTKRREEERVLPSSKGNNHL